MPSWVSREGIALGSRGRHSDSNLPTPSPSPLKTLLRAVYPLLDDLAVANLGAGDMVAYRQACADMLRRFGRTEDPATADRVAWACVLSPGAVADPSQVVKLAEKGAGQAGGSDSLLTLGAALFRAGRFREAVRRLDEAARGCKDGEVPWGWVFLAMAHRQLGHPEEARGWLGKATGWLEQTAPDTAGDAAGGAAYTWSERVGFRLLYREAQATLKGKQP